MKVWSCVELFGGIVQVMNVFPSMEIAREYFHSFINNYGSVEDCDPDFYNDGEGACFYWSNGDDDAEIHIWPVKMEMEG